MDDPSAPTLGRSSLRRRTMWVRLVLFGAVGAFFLSQGEYGAGAIALGVGIIVWWVDRQIRASR